LFWSWFETPASNENVVWVHRDTQPRL
ncbi:ATP-binding protein, partial [Vibrio anguillarum]